MDLFTNLETHIQEISESQAQLDRMNLLSKAVKSYSETNISQEVIMGYAARVRCTLHEESRLVGGGDLSD